jgi:VanZ family protein
MVKPLSRNSAIAMLAVLLALLLIGTLIPGAWRHEAFEVSKLPWQMNKVAHFMVFACMAFVAYLAPLAQPQGRICAAALALALLTESLQYLASDRDPSWRDVGFDMGGALYGLALARGYQWLSKR